MLALFLLTQMVNFPTGIPDYKSAFFEFLSCDAGICSAMTFPPLENSDHVGVSVSIVFPSSSQQDASCHCIAYDGFRDHLRNVPWEDIFKLTASAVAGECCCRLKLMYISLIVKIRSSLIHLRGFQLFLLLP